MPNIQSHANGSFSWMELATSDQDAAKKFYTALLDWTFEDSPMGPGQVYTMFQRGSGLVAAAYTLQDQEKSMGIPPHWNLYITVASADDSAKKAAEAGGKVLAGPFDVYSYGRMAVIQDPTGAAFCIWEAKEHIGATIGGETGTMCWADLNTPDADSAARFYADVFGWTLDPGANGYLHIKNGEEFIGGIPPAAHRDPHTPPNWLIYIQVDDCDTRTARAKELGAKICAGPMTIEKTGRMTVLTDPQQAAFALFQPLPRA